MRVRCYLATPIALALTSTIAYAQGPYYETPAYRYYAPPAAYQYYAAPRVNRYYAPRVANRYYYAPPVTSYGPSVRYYAPPVTFVTIMRRQ